MSEDGRRLDPTAPWERPWAVSPAPVPPPALPPLPRRMLHDDGGGQIRVSDLLRRIGHRPGTSASHGGPAAAESPSGDGPAQPTLGADRGQWESDTVVMGVIAPGAATPAPDAAALTRLQTKKSRRQRRVTIAGKATVGVIAVLVFGVTGSAWAGLRYVESNTRTVPSLDQGSTAIQQPEQQLGDENFLLVGSDTRAGTSGDLGAGTTNQVAGARSDTLIVAHIPADRSRVVLVSFPRDLQVDLPSCTRWDNATASYTTEVLAPQQGVKINEAYFSGGPRCATKIVQQLSGLNINHFLGIDFAGFEAMVNAVGGVQVCTDAPLEDTVLGTILPTAGTKTIDGAQALNYVRARHVIGDPTSDYGRIQRQQRFLSSLLRASLRQETLLNVGKLKSLVDAVTSSTFGENVGVKSLLSLAQSLQRLDAGRVTFVTAPTTGTANSIGNEVLLTTENAALFQAIREGRPLPGETPAPPSATPTPTTTPPAANLVALSPGTVQFNITNAAGMSGLAARTAMSLSRYGFTAAVTDSAPVVQAGAVVRYAAADLAAAQTLASAVPGATLQLSTDQANRVDLVLGSAYTGVTAPPIPAGTPLPRVAAGPASSPTPLPGDLAVVNGGDVTCR